MVPISPGKRGRDTGSPACREATASYASACWRLWHLRVVTQRGENALQPVRADLPPGIDQKQINFHFQLGRQLSQSDEGEIVMFT